MPASKRHLQAIELEGYKSFKNLPRFSLNYGLNVLLGANGSGKTNFIRFFELLRHMLDPNLGLQNYLAERGRADAFLFQGSKATSQMSARLWFDLNEYRFTLKAAADRSLFFAEESAPYEGPYFGSVQNNQGSGHTESNLARKTHRTKAEQWVIDTISDWRVYHFHDTGPQAPVMGLCNMVHAEQLRSDAGNLAAFLWALRRQEETIAYYNRIVKTIRLVAPYFGDFVFKEISPGQTQLLWKERFSDLEFYPYQFSDGTLRFICLATLLLQPNPPGTIIIDEPELGLHPYALATLAGLLRQASEATQIIVSTQSRPLVDQLSPQDLLIADRIEGETTLKHPDPKELENWLREYSLGELWDKNVLGGRPTR